MLSNQRSGFTLLELTVGMLVTGLALSMGYGAYGVALDRREAVEARLEADLAAAAVRTTLTGWIESIQLESSGGPALLTGLDATAAGIASDEVTMLALLQDGPAERAPVRVFIDRDPDTSEHGLVAEWRRPGTTHLVRTPLAEQVVGLEISYLSAVLGVRRWLPSWVSSSVLPVGVEFRFIGSADEPLHPLLALPLRVHLEGGR